MASVPTGASPAAPSLGGSASGGSVSGRIVGASVPSVLAKNNGHHNFILTKSGLPPALLQILGAAGAIGKPNRGNPQYSYNLPYTDLNPFMRTYCDGLGVEIGSDWFLAYGCALYPGQTGGQPDFGWRQDHRIPRQSARVRSRREGDPRERRLSPHVLFG